MPHSSHKPTPRPEDRDTYIMALKRGHTPPEGWKEELQLVKGLSIVSSGKVSFRVSAPPGVIGPLVAKFSEDFHIELLIPHTPQGNEGLADLNAPRGITTQTNG